MMKSMNYSGTHVHVHQNERSNKAVCFSESSKSPKPILHETPEIEFKLESPNMLFTREPEQVGWSM